jgi:FtsP/CotA-like multicopper oxidase with cupredoxin domain
MTVVQADGNDVEPVVVDECRMGVAEIYDVIVQPSDDKAYTIFAQAEDRTGFARGTLTPSLGLTATVPPMDPRPSRTMMDMGTMNRNTTSSARAKRAKRSWITRPWLSVSRQAVSAWAYAIEESPVIVEIGVSGT